jgi:hypothetical protein
LRRVTRPLEPPPFLSSPRVLQERQQLLSFLRRDTDERRQRRDELNEDLFYAEELVAPLRDLFRGKCAFCEREASSGVLLHLRPLRYAHQGSSGEHRYLGSSRRPDDKDYYLWLAFEWRNLFYACEACAKIKGDAFPVSGLRARYLASFEDVEQTEERLLVDPTIDNPYKHLRFVHSGACIAMTCMGEVTKLTFQLDRPDLAKDRAGRLRHLTGALHDAPERPALHDIYELLADQAPHSAVLHAFLRRAASAWRRGGAPIRGSGLAFVRGFLRAVEQASPKELVGLQSALRDVVEADERLEADPPRFHLEAAARPEDLDERRARYEAQDREIAAIEIRSFKAIEGLTFQMRSSRGTKAGAPCMMILGENSTAKSSVLQAIALALIGSDEAAKFRDLLPSFVRSPGMERFDQLDQQRVEVSLRFHHSDHLAHLAYDPTNKRLEGYADPSTVVLGYGPRRYFDPKLRNRGRGAAARVRTLFSPLATIPYPADWLREQTGSRFDTIAAALRVVLALNDDDELLVQPDTVAVRANGRVSPIDSLSEGYRSVFVMTVDILRELIEHWSHLEQAQAVVLIDELETHLHPRWKMQVMTSLRRVLPRVQFIATTHDPLCLRGMDDDEVQVLQRDEMGRITRLEQLPSVRGMTAEQLLTSDYFGLSSTADPSLEIELARVAGDVVRRRGDTIVVAPSEATRRLVSQLTVGDSPSEQVIQEALRTYLEQREAGAGVPRPELRSEAVAAVVHALRSGA